MNWVKLSKNVVSSTGTLWHQTSKGDADLAINVNPHVVEELFSQQEVQKKAKKEEEKKTPSVVM